MWGVFADPKIDSVFKRIFGSEPNKPLLAELLNALLELEGDQRVAVLTYLSPEERVPVAELKLTNVDVRCRDHAGREYLVQMQILNVEAFEKRVVANVSKSCVRHVALSRSPNARVRPAALPVARSRRAPPGWLWDFAAASKKCVGYSPSSSTQRVGRRSMRCPPSSLRPCSPG